MSAKSVRGEVIGYHQGRELLQALEKAGLTSELAQEIIGSRGNRSARAMLSALSGAVLTDDRFQLVKSFGIVVPENYDYSTRLDTFRASHKKEFYYYNDAITDVNFNHPSFKLSPGLKFSVKVFQITETVTSEDCLKFLKSQPKSVLLGAQGASLVYEQRKSELPKGRWHVSFDEKENLWEDSGRYHWVPSVYAPSAGDFDFPLGYFEYLWPADNCLLCFCDEN
jgi:hypothetical protein